MSISGKLHSGDDTVKDTVNQPADMAENTVKPSEDTVNHAVDDTVKTPMELLQMFDSDSRPVRSKKEGGHRTDVYLSEEEKEMLDFIANEEGATGQSVLRVSLKYVYRNVYRKRHRK